MINWDEVVKLIDYNFDSIGACSTVDYEDPKYGELSFLWEGNKSKLDITFVDTCNNCICIKTEDIARHIADCDCDWIAWHESNWQHKEFTKKQVINIKQQIKLDFKC